jgi:hypothetical protein
MKYGLLSTYHALLKPFQVHHDGIEKYTNFMLDISKMISCDVHEVDSLAVDGWLVKHYYHVQC